MKKIAVAVTGSVAAVKTPKLIRELVRKGFIVEAVLSPAAQKIITPEVIHWACGKKPATKLTGELEHVKLCGLEGEADFLLIYPATSNTISKIACGIDDTPVTTCAATALASGTKIIIAPAMHQSMYENPFVAENIEKLKKAGIVFVGPNIQEGKAKIAQPGEVVEEIMKLNQDE